MAFEQMVLTWMYFYKNRCLFYSKNEKIILNLVHYITILDDVIFLDINHRKCP